MYAWAVVDRTLGNAHAHLTRERGQKPVHLAVESQWLHDLGPEGLQRTSVVVQPYARGPGNQTIRQKRGQPAADQGVLPLLTPAAHDVKAALIQHGDEARDVARIV